MKKRGFTLVELLAVVIVLGIIALIAVPQVMDQVEESRKESYEASVRSIFDAVNTYLANNIIVSDIPASGVMIPNSDFYKALDLKNAKFTGGKIYRDAEGVMVVENVTDGVYCASGKKGELTVVKGSCGLLDATPPTINIAPSRITSNSIMIAVNSSDGESGIAKYQYYLSKNTSSGKVYQLVAETDDNVYTFRNLLPNVSYDIKVVVTNGNGLKTENIITIKTSNKDIEWKPTPEDWSKSKTITIKYPKRSGGEVYRYRVIGKTDWINIVDETVDVLINEVSTIQVQILENNVETYRIEKLFSKIDNEGPKIISILGNDDEWTKAKAIQIVANDSDKAGLASEAYSFDGGQTWQAKSESESFMTEAEVKIAVRDRLGNITNTTVKINKIDNTIPQKPTITAKTESGEVYNSGTWKNESIILTPQTNPSNPPSGYNYRWYKKSDDNYLLVSSGYNLKLTSEQEATYMLEVWTKAGSVKVKSDAFVVKIDTTSPECSWSGESTEWALKRDIKLTCDDNLSNCTDDTKTKIWSFNETKEIAPLSYEIMDNAKNSTICSIIANVYSDPDGPKITIDNENVTTRTATVKFTVTDSGSGVDNKSYKCAFGKTKGTYNINGTINDSVCTSTDLEANTKYYYQIVAKDTLKNESKIEDDLSTNKFESITINVDPEGVAKEKVATIIGETAGAWLEWSFSSTGPWTKIESGGTVDITEDVKLYVRFSDGKNTIDPKVLVINLDTDAPTITMVKTSTTTQSITLDYIVLDSESEVEINECFYRRNNYTGTYSKGDITVDSSGYTVCTFNGLRINTKYDYKIEVKDEVGNPNTIEGSATTVNFSTCSISVDKPDKWSTSKNITVSGVTDGAQLQYRIGNSGEWKKIGNNESFTLTENNTIYCGFVDNNDATNIINASSMSVTKIDTKSPVITLSSNSSGGNWSTEDIYVSYSVSESGSGIKECVYNYDDDVYNSYEGDNWGVMTPEIISSTINETDQIINYKENFTAERNTNVNMKCYDEAGNESNTISTSIKIDKTGPELSNVVNSSGGKWWTDSKQNMTISYKITENGSGYSYCEYLYDDDVHSPYCEGTNWCKTTPTPNSNSINTHNFSAERNTMVNIRCYDAAGNVSNTIKSTVKIDKSGPTAPTITTGTYAGTATTSNQIVWISSASVDAVSGIKKYQYCESTTNSSSGCTWKDLYNNTAGVSVDGMDVAFYHSYYHADLPAAFNGNVTSLVNHYNSYGKNEGRLISGNWLRTSQNISTTGGRYVFFRAVNNAGLVSTSSTSKYVNITSSSTSGGSGTTEPSTPVTCGFYYSNKNEITPNSGCGRFEGPCNTFKMYFTASEGCTLKRIEVVTCSNTICGTTTTCSNDGLNIYNGTDMFYFSNLKCGYDIDTLTIRASFNETDSTRSVTYKLVDNVLTFKNGSTLPLTSYCSS